MTAARRVSVSLDDADEAVLGVFADPARAEHASLEAWASRHGTSVRNSSEAAVIRLLARAGAEALLERALEDGYDKLAAADAERAERRALRGRYADRVDRRFVE